MKPTPGRWVVGGPHVLAAMRAAPRARRIYYDWDDVKTSPDLQLDTAFEHTQPGVELRGTSFEEEPTINWLIPGIGLLIGGFFIGKWWVGRNAAPHATVVAGDDFCGLDILGAS